MLCKKQCAIIIINNKQSNLLLKNWLRLHSGHYLKKSTPPPLLFSKIVKTPAGVYSDTPAPVHLWSVAQKNKPTTMLPSSVQSIDLPMDCTAWRFWTMRWPNGCSTPAPKSSAAKQWIEELTQKKKNHRSQRNSCRVRVTKNCDSSRVIDSSWDSHNVVWTTVKKGPLL